MTELKLFLIFLISGIIIATGWGLLNFIKIIFKQNKILKHVLEGVYACAFVLAFFVLLINLNFGVFRLYLAFAFGLGFIFERKTLGILFAKLYTLIYNKICKSINKIKQTKFAKRVLR